MASIGPPALGAKGCVERLRRFAQGATAVEGAFKFIEGASLYKNHTTALRASQMHPPLVAGATTLPGRKHVTGFAGRLQLPYESSSFATPAVRWGGKRKAP